MKQIIYILFCLSFICCKNKQPEQQTTHEIRFITLDPGHFHAALVQKTSYPGVSPDVYVYAPEGEDLQEHLKRIEGYNNRNESPTNWNQIIYTGKDFPEKMVSQKKGNVMITAGNNRKKTDYIEQALRGGIHVLADKPMAINTRGFEQLKKCFAIAEDKDLLLYDIMTERFEIVTILQKEFSLLEEVYGEQQKGSPDNPGIAKESVHHFLKTVSGNPLRRPAWFFDIEQEGAGIVDVTTHLVDLIQWECFPEQIIQYETDIELLDANQWATSLTPTQFEEVTGLSSYPDYLQKDVKDNMLEVYANGDILYTIKGVHAKVSIMWNYSFPEGGGDTHYSIMKGSKSHLIIEQGKEQNYKPVLYIHAVPGIHLETYEKELNRGIQKIAVNYPGITLTKQSATCWQVNVPEVYHNGHEAHFGQVTENFIRYLTKGNLPAWEVPNMIAKYYVTTHALELAQKKNQSTTSVDGGPR